MKKHFLLPFIFGVSLLSMPFDFYAQPLDCITYNCSNNNNIKTKTSHWYLSNDGKASPAPNWNNRLAIISDSSNGSLVLYPPNTNNNYNDTLALQPFNNRKRDSLGNIYISFREYYRHSAGTTKVEYSINNSGSWTSINVNSDVPAFYETPRYRTVILPIVMATNSPVNVNVRLITSGKIFFWIIDDISVCNKYPSPTLPNPELGEYLFKTKHPYEVDINGHPYVPNELVVRFKKGISEAEKQVVRHSNFVKCYTTCICDSLEKWKIIYPDAPNDPNGNFRVGAEEKTPTAGSLVTRNGEPNYYTFDHLFKNMCNPSVSDANSGAAKKTELKIAILDTGCDLSSSQSGKLYPFRNTTERGNDEDGNCLQRDFKGYNFIDESGTCQLGNNSNNDNNGHGSHVLGIVDMSLKTLQGNAPSATYIPIKVLDGDGIGTLFSTSCGIYYAAQKKANVINCSWGYYQKEFDENGSIMLDAIRYANTQKSLLICSAGNNALLIREPDIHLPSSYREPNVVAVSAMRQWDTSSNNGNTTTANINGYNGVELHSTSNYSTTYVDIGAFGYNIKSNDCFSGNIKKRSAVKSGTSMAAPVVSAAALYYFKQLGISATPQSVKDLLLGNSSPHNLKCLKIENGEIKRNGSLIQH